MIEFALVDDSTQVFFNGSLTAVGALYSEKVKQDPQCQIAYHTVAMSVTNPGSFKLKQEHKVVFVKKDDTTDPGQNSIGAKVPAEVVKSKLSGIAWAVHWTQTGLMPIKPTVHVMHEITMGTGRAAQVSG